MKRLKAIIIFFLFFIFMQGVSYAQLSDIQQTAANIGQQFSDMALESIKSVAGENAAGAAEWYQDLGKNEVLIYASAAPYQNLGGNAAFSAEVAEHILRGGASSKRTMRIISKLGTLYGKLLARVYEGGRVTVASQEFMMSFTFYVDNLRINPGDYSRAIRRVRAQFSKISKIVKSSKK